MKLRYALVQNSLDGISAEVHYAFESGADVVETFSEWDAACSRMNQLYSEHGIAEQPVSLAASRWPYPAPPLPIRASGHGQGTEERVERAAREIVALELGHDGAEFSPADMTNAPLLARRILAAADAVLGREEEGVSVKPCPFCGSAVRVQTHGIACDGCGLWYGAGSLAVDRWRELHGTPLAPIPRDVSWLVEVWNLRAALRSAADAVPISAPPVTKGEGDD